MNQWLIEVLPGIFVGRVNARVRDVLWESLSEAISMSGDNEYAAYIVQENSEQGYSFQTAGYHRYRVEDFAGLQLISVLHNTRQESLDTS